MPMFEQQVKTEGSENNQELQLESERKTEQQTKIPLLFVDVNIDEGRTARIVVYEGDKSEDLAEQFREEHGKIYEFCCINIIGLDMQMKDKLKELLDAQIDSLLTKIDEGGDEDEDEED